MIGRWRALVLGLVVGCDGAGKDPADDTDTVDTEVVDDTVDTVDTDAPDTDVADTDVTDTDVADTDVADTDTALPVPDPVPFTVVPGPFLTPGAIEPGTWWITSAADYTTLLGEPAPAELVAGTHGAVAWYAGDRAWLSAWPEITGLVSYGPGGLTLQTTTHELEAGCDRFSTYLPVIAVALTPLPTAPVTAVSTRSSATPMPCTAGGLESQTCALDTPCGPGLLCGLISQVDLGICMESVQLGSFAGTGVGAIPDGRPVGLQVEFEVSGIATVPIDVLITLDLDHPRPEDLYIVLTAPSGAQGEVWGLGSHAGGAFHLRRAVAGFPADEFLGGTWTLYVNDPILQQAGSVTSATLELMSQWD